MGARSDFYRIVREAVRDVTEHGYDGPTRIAGWVERIKAAAQAAMMPAHELERTLVGSLRSIYTKLVDKGGLLKLQPGVHRFTVERLRPKLRNELDRRILASANLIKLNREQAIAKTLQRFSGWSTSIPSGGAARTVDKGDVSSDVRKALGSLPYRERVVAVDQGHKLAASLNEIVAVDGGAIALVWHSHWRQRGYNYREDHKERDQEIYAVRGNWAQKRGLMKVGPAGYYDEITSVGEEPMCRCYAQFVFHLRELPEDMLTIAGKKELERVRIAMAS